MLGVKITIVRYVSDEPQPGIVEIQLQDAHGRRWSFVDKTAIVVSANRLDSQTVYPKVGVIACEVVERSVSNGGREVTRITTQRPWHVESVEGATVFDVLPESLLELN